MKGGVIMLLSFNITKCGKSHEMHHKPGQDYSCCRKVMDNIGRQWAICAVADGVGSCSNSHYGSKTAAVCAVDYTAEELRKEPVRDDEQALKILQNAYCTALEAVEEKADDMQMPIISFDTTLTVAVFNGIDLYYGHSGDGGIVVLYSDGCYEMITKRQKGEETTSVFPLRAKEYWVFGKSDKRVASLALMTDGVLDAVVDETLNNRVYIPFFRPVLTADADSEADEIVLKDYMERVFSEEKYRERVTDDISFAMILETQAVSELPDIKFDAEAWERETLDLIQKKREFLDYQAKLYAQKQTIMHKTPQNDTYGHTFQKVRSILWNVLESSADLGIQCGGEMNRLQKEKRKKVKDISLGNVSEKKGRKT